MNRKAILIALVLSVIVAGTLWKKIQSTPRNGDLRILPPKIETKPLVVAKKRIPVRTRLEAKLLDEMFEIKEINASDAAHFPDAFTSIASLANRFTAVTILKGDIMTSQRVLADDAVPDLAHAIPPGKRAVSIAVSKVTGVGGFIQQGNYVDVIAIFRPKAGETLSKIVLQDILVLAVGNMYQFDGTLASTPPAIAAGKVDLVTLAVTPEELERLMFLESGVTFRLVLKNPKDKDQKVQTPGANEKAVLKGLGIDEAEAAPAKVATPKVPPAEFKEPPSLVLPPAPPTEPVAKQPPPPEPTPAVAAVVPPKDDGKVEIWYGSSDKKKEFFRETSPSRKAATSGSAVRPTSLPTPVKPSEPDIANPGGF